MTNYRRGLVSGINSFTIEELANKMLHDEVLANNVRLYCKNNNMNEQTRAHAKLSYDLFRILRRERLKVRIKETKARVDAAKQVRREKWLENNPDTLRFKTVLQILEVIETDSAIRSKVSSYLSRTKIQISADFRRRLRMAMIAYYLKTKPNSPVLTKHLDKLFKEQEHGNTISQINSVEKR